jgi:rhodanese-related sulfurtransferase
VVIMNNDNKTFELYKTRLFEQFGKIGSALASPRRLELLDLLGQAERPVEALCAEMGLSPSSVSQHLKVLKEAHLVESRSEGLHHHYRLSDDTVAEFWSAFRRLAASRLPELREVLRAHRDQDSEFELVDPEELMQRIERGEAIVLDVRPEIEYRASHLPGARSLPLADLQRRLEEIPRDKELIAYCRGPYCLMAREAVRILRREGFQAHHLEDGPLEWAEAGRPVERE